MPPPEAIFLELITNKQKFGKEFHSIVEEFLAMKKVEYDKELLLDLFKFQITVMAQPSDLEEKVVTFEYNWVDYFLTAFNLICRRLPPKLTNFQNIISGSKHSAQRVGRNFIGLS